MFPGAKPFLEKAIYDPRDYPDEFGPDKWDIDVDKLFEEEP